jgi:hypothetical protein
MLVPHIFLSSFDRSWLVCALSTDARSARFRVEFSRGLCVDSVRLVSSFSAFLAVASLPSSALFFSQQQHKSNLLQSISYLVRRFAFRLSLVRSLLGHLHFTFSLTAV